MEQLTATDCSRLASLHLEALPDSLISELGLRFAASFYRYASRSPVDKVFVARNARGEVSGGCLRSLRRATLHRRLILHTPLLLYALPWFLRKFLNRKAARV